MRRDAYDAFVTRPPGRLLCAGGLFDRRCGYRWPNRAFHDVAQGIEVDGLPYEVVCTEFDGSLNVVELRIGGDHDDGASVAIFLQLIENFDTGKIGQAHIEEGQIGRFALSQPQGLLTGLGFDDGVAPFFAFLAQRPAHQALIVHDHDFLGRHSRSHLLQKLKRPYCAAL